MKKLTIDKFNENNAVFRDNKWVADNPDFPLCAENETYQNEIVFIINLTKMINNMSILSDFVHPIV
jgi:hypothetical protein